MALPILWTDDGLQDVMSIVEWVKEENPAAAQKIRDVIIENVELLAQLPHGRVGRVAGTYEKVVSGLPYIIAYTTASMNQQKTLVVLRIVHSSRDWSHVFEK